MELSGPQEVLMISVWAVWPTASFCRHEHSHYSSYQSLDRCVCMSAVEQLRGCRARHMASPGTTHVKLFRWSITVASYSLARCVHAPKERVRVCAWLFVSVTEGTRWDWWVPHGVYILLHVLIKKRNVRHWRQTRWCYDVCQPLFPRQGVTSSLVLVTFYG